MLKILIAGGFGVGKTTMVGAVSDIEPLSTEEVMTAAGQATDDLDGIKSKTTTTVALDFGRLTLPGDVPLELYLFGMPGQDRFTDYWHDLAYGAAGAVVLADTRRLTVSYPAIDFFEQMRLPFVIALNEFDGAHRYHPEQVRTAMDLHPGIPVVTCDARSQAAAVGTLVTLIEHALDAVPADSLLLDAP
ncbi:ATP-binding protein [Streptomyces sp. LBUM 1476]|nr:ATP-binding protein [Streptomyces sp. LBUM 1476]MBZ3915243.1 ATP/GTP-binding protein [Streptomyces acidiscabies]